MKISRRAFLAVVGVCVLDVKIGVWAMSSDEGRIASHLLSIDFDKVNWSEIEDDYYRKVLLPFQYSVCRKGKTEKPFSGRYYNDKRDGIFMCSVCGNKLFSSKAKFDSGTGWPSFYEPYGQDSVELREDRSFFMVRTEVVCKRCKSHLGHVFDDGPPPTGKRYCINSVCLILDKDLAKLKEAI